MEFDWLGIDEIGTENRTRLPKSLVNRNNSRVRLCAKCHKMPAAREQSARRKRKRRRSEMIRDRVRNNGDC